MERKIKMRQKSPRLANQSEQKDMWTIKALFWTLEYFSSYIPSCFLVFQMFIASLAGLPEMLKLAMRLIQASAGLHQSQPWYQRSRSGAVDGRLMALTVELIEGNALSVDFPGGF